MSLPPIQCLHVTDDFVRELNDGNPSFKVPNPVPSLRFLYELCWSMVYGLLPLQKCKAALDAVEFSDTISEDDVASSLADVVTQMALDLIMPMEMRARLNKLARWLVESSLVPMRFFQERCEEEFLWECEMVKIKAQELKSKEVRVNTRLLYQQTKFNLLREESEGYVKLVTLLCEGSEAPNSSSTIGTIKSLIGHFDLDPNRVFDIVLECFEMHPFNNIFLDLVPIFSKSHASQILGFKFQYYQRMEVQDPVPFGLYQLAALLVKQDYVDLDSIYAHLLPKDDEAFEVSSTVYAKRLDEANRIGKINLAATGKDLMDDDKQADVTIDLYTALDMENNAVAESVQELENSQTLGLLTGFLYVDDWYHANILFERLSPLIPVAHHQICSGLFRLIEKSISSVYDIVCENHFQDCGSSMNDYETPETTDSVARSPVLLPGELFEMLACAGPYLYRNTLLLQKVCRVLKAYYISAQKLVSKGDGAFMAVGGVNIVPRLHLREARLRVEEALGSCLLPSLQLIPANPAVAQEIWEVMSLLPYEVRYRLYGEWEKDNERIPMILAARQTAKLDTRRILKRLAKENLKQLGRMVAKIAHANPLTVLRTIVQQIEAYRDMITPVVDAFKYLTQLEYDVLEYVVIERLVQSGREKLKDDGLNLSDWLQSLASFWGHLCKKYPSMELKGLFQYLVNQLKRGLGIELILLQELMQQMANVQYTENMTEEQVESMAGGETLRHLATSFGASRNNKALIKSTNRLRDSLLSKEEPVLAIPLLLLIAQHRSMVVVNAKAPYIKMVSEEFDRCHGVLLQYVDFLCCAVSPPTAYAKLIPTLHDLVHLYHLDPEVAFLIYRPVMRLFKHQRRSITWPLCDDESTVGKESHSSCVDNMVLDLGSQNPMRWANLLNTVRTMLPLKAWNSLSPDLYATFWGLTLYDLHVPRSRYESEIAKQHAALKALEELSDNSSSAITKRKKDKERIQDSLDRLISELQKHEDNVSSVRRRLASEKDKWLSSCPDTLKINMEFLQRCIFPRCTFSMPDAVYCAMFVHTLHSLGTPYFNTVNHIDVLICKTLHPMICCCTEYEAGRLGRFLYETLKIAYYWKSDESVYERECGNMPGFAVYYRYPNSQRVTYGQFIKVHWKWSQRITRLLIQCLESSEYMEIRNALIMLTKISSVFPVTRKSGINIEKRVAKIKGDDREDLKVLATGVGAALAARKHSWVTEEEFGMGYVELKPAPSGASKSSTGNGSGVGVAQQESTGGRVASEILPSDSGNILRDPSFRNKTVNGRLERPESSSGNAKVKGSSMTNVSDAQTMSAQHGTTRSLENQKHVDDLSNRTADENTGKATLKGSIEIEARVGAKRGSSGISSRPLKQDLKDENKPVKASGRNIGASGSEVDHSIHSNETKHAAPANGSSLTVTNGGAATSSKDLASSTRMEVEYLEVRGEVAASKSSDLKGSLRDDDADSSDLHRPLHSRSTHSPRHDTTSKLGDRQQKRTSSSEELDRLHKKKKGDVEVREMEADIRFVDRERISERVLDRNYADFEKAGSEELTSDRFADKHFDRMKDKSSEKSERDYRDRSERIDKSRSDDTLSDKLRDRSMERYGRERSVDRIPERRIDRGFDGLGDRVRDEKSKDDRTKLRYNEISSDKSHIDERFHSQNLPPPPPLPPNMVPQSVAGNRREDDVDRRFGPGRQPQRLSPRHEEKERRRSEESFLTAQDDSKRRREDEFKERKREERETLSLKAEDREREKDKERERERERANLLKEEMDLNAASKRRKLKRDHIPGGEPGEYSSGATSSSISLGISQFDSRERGDRKGSMVQRPGYFEEPGMRMHVKEAASKMGRRDIDPLYDREWDEEKRRVEVKRRHRK